MLHAPLQRSCRGDVVMGDLHGGSMFNKYGVLLEGNLILVRARVFQEAGSDPTSVHQSLRAVAEAALVESEWKRDWARTLLN